MVAPRRRPILAQSFQLAVLIAVTFAAYYPTLSNGFIWDDDRYIQRNMQLRTTEGLERIWLDPLTSEPQYYPLTHTTLWLEYRLWGQRPMGYHLDNILLHAASAAILWRILRRLNVGGAWAAAIIFAVHPLQVESVAWATERKNVLSGVLYFLSLWAYLHTRWGRRIWRDEEGSRIGAGWYSASLLLFVSALLAKSVASTLPAAILLLCWWKRGRIRSRDVWPLVPMLCAGLVMGSFTRWMEKHVVGAIGPNFDFLTPLDRCCIAGRALWFYLVKLIWSRPLAFIYPHWQIDPLRRPWWILFPVSATGILMACVLLRRRIGRGPATAALFFAGTLVPALGFVNVFPMQYSFVADHFQYIACIGPIVLIVEGVRRWGRAQRNPGILYMATAIVVASLCIAGNLRARVFRDRLTLWSDTLAKNPGSAVAHNNYAAALAESGDIPDAKLEYRRAINLRNDGGDWVGLGQCYAAEGDFITARDMYVKALELTPDSSEFVLRSLRAGREFQLGTAYQGLAKEFPARAAQYLADAEQAYLEAVRLYPKYEDPRTNLVVVLLDEGRVDEAIEQCKLVLAADPDSVSAHTNLGAAYYGLNRLGDAAQEYYLAIQLDPNNAGALASLGVILAQEGRLDEAIAALQQAARIDPKNALVQQDLATAISMRNRNRR